MSYAESSSFKFKKEQIQVSAAANLNLSKTFSSGFIIGAEWTISPYFSVGATINPHFFATPLAIMQIYDIGPLLKLKYTLPFKELQKKLGVNFSPAFGLSMYRISTHYLPYTEVGVYLKLLAGADYVIDKHWSVFLDTGYGMAFNKLIQHSFVLNLGTSYRF